MMKTLPALILRVVLTLSAAVSLPAAQEDHDDHGSSDALVHEHEDEPTVEVSESARLLADIRLVSATLHRLSTAIEIPGRISFNEDRLAHLTPRYGGIVRDVTGKLGALVEEGKVLAQVENNQTLSTYSVRTPFAGHIIEKHAVPGEYVSETTSMFVIADLSSVWADLDVYTGKLDAVTVGSRVTIRAVGMDLEQQGTISYVAPLFHAERRAAVARVVLPNPDGQWRPGAFVRAELERTADAPVLAVEHEAIQLLNGEPVVFVPVESNRFRAEPVVTGVRGRTHTEIVSGLSPGDPYVVYGAFELVAELVTRSLGDHANHGH